jgi:hypothetical protein
LTRGRVFTSGEEEGGGGGDAAAKEVSGLEFDYVQYTIKEDSLVALKVPKPQTLNTELITCQTTRRETRKVLVFLVFWFGLNIGV